MLFVVLFCFVLKRLVERLTFFVGVGFGVRFGDKFGVGRGLLWELGKSQGWELLKCL